ncbi:hypothetical protein Ahy_B06g080703 [Arachis hypogaea]|uniref:Uncharacterized protein n=1 Tax=Arachis hypogaea TaxID=3818 RepID=A0A444YIT4_ARAHY|nr:hypothetical protein Ahy_B06g080703 [Arachis hypogaea]
MGRRLQQMLKDVREGRDHLTTWLRLEINKVLLVHWETDEGFRHRSLTNRANRISARSSKYTYCSATFVKTKVILVCSVFNFYINLSLDPEATLVDTFKYAHTLKENKVRFADQRSQDHYESYTQRLEAATQQSQQSGEDATDGSATLVVDFDAVCHVTASALYKNYVYELGSFFASSLRTSMLRLSSVSATSRAVEPKEGMDLRLQVQELTRNLHQQTQELNDRKRYKEILTRVTDMDDLRLEWREQLKRLQRMEDHMEVY